MNQNCNYPSVVTSAMTCFSIVNCALIRLRNQAEKCGIFISEIVTKKPNELTYNRINDAKISLVQIFH